MTRLLIVDDSALMRRLLRDIFARAGGFELRSARNGAEALDMIKAERPDVVTLDISMPEMDGLTCLSRIMVETPCPVVMVSSLTAHGAEVTIEALRLGAVDFVAKPEGILSLGMEMMRTPLVETVRAAAATRLRGTFRLADRVRHQAGMAAAPSFAAPGFAAPGFATAGFATQGFATTREAERGFSRDGILLIGTSTGGPRALETVLTALPAQFPLPILVAQHMPSNFTGVFARRLNESCQLEVVEVATALPIEPGRVYIGRGDADLIVAARPGGPAVLSAPALPGSLWHPSVDRLVRSCMEHYAASAIVGVLMTGMGYDGAEAMAALHDAGGRTIAEAEATAIVWGMPGELVRRGGAGQVLPLTRIADALLAMATHAAH
jgi:two-component system chemotaxis response regulator CheB